MPYWAIKPKGREDVTRIEKANTAEEACRLAFGRPIFRGNYLAKNLGTRVSVIQSDRKRIALLTSEDGWEVVQ